MLMLCGRDKTTQHLFLPMESSKEIKKVVESLSNTFKGINTVLIQMFLFFYVYLFQNVKKILENFSWVQGNMRTVHHLLWNDIKN